MAQLPPGGDTFTTPDPVVWAKIIPGGQDHADDHRGGSHGYRETWLVRVSAANTPTAAVRASRRLPAEGFPLYQHVPATDPLLLGTYVRADGPVVLDADAAVVLREVRATDDPYFFECVISYEGVDDPTAEPPEFAVEEVAYQEHVTTDVTGKPVTNSAFDPIDGGMPTEGFYKRLTITRNLPFAAWHSKKADPYRKTLNKAVFTYPGQLDGGNPVAEAAGTCLLDSVREQRVLRARGVGAASSYYWRVTAELLVDLRAIRLPGKVLVPGAADVAAGASVLRAHRWVVPDAGYSAFVDNGSGEMRKRPISAGGHPVSQPQLLNGKGEALLPNSTLLEPIAFTPFARTGCFGELCPDFYATTGPLSVSDANGVLANDFGVTSVEVVDDPAHSSSFSLNAGGGFTYTPASGFAGWDFFTYKATGADDATRQTCQILVGAVPVLLFFDRYRTADWSALSALLEGW